MGEVGAPAGSTHRKLSLTESLDYIDRVFDDYLTYSGLSARVLHGKRVLEIGPGDNLGVALKFLVAGASQVVCLDKFFSERDPRQQYRIYQALRERLDDHGKRVFDMALRLDRENRIQVNQHALSYVYGTSIERADAIFEPLSFDLIVSRAVVQDVHDTDAAFSAMDKLLARGGHLIHKIDLRDYGVFDRDVWPPLTFLTIPDRVYRLMTGDLPAPNRRLVNYYRRKMDELGYDARMLITSVLGAGGEVVPHKQELEYGADYFNSTISLIRSIRPRLLPRYKKLPDEDLMVAGIFLVARKPESG